MKLKIALLSAVLATTWAGNAVSASRDYISIVGSSTVYPFATVVAETFGKSFNMAVALAWGITLLFSIWLNISFGVEVFFLGLPGWFVAAILYLLFSVIIQKKNIEEKK